MNGGYPQDYQRGPPPQQRYPQGGYQQRPNPQYAPQGRGYDHRPPPQRAQYPTQQSAHRPPPPAQQRPQEWQTQAQYTSHHNDGYEYNDQYGPDDNRYYQDQHQYQNAPQQYDYQDHRHSDDRQYQYDDRYRTQNQRPPPQQYHPNNAQSPPYANHAPLPSTDSRNKPRERERILRPEDESPKTAAWDNPFGAFPTKKSQDKSNRTSNETDRVKSTGSQPHLGDRHSASRPSTSRGPSRQSDTSQNRVQGSTPPQHQEYQRHPPQDQFREPINQYRPPPRAMTGPIPQHVPNDYDQPHPGMNRQHTYGDFSGAQGSHDGHPANYSHAPPNQPQEPFVHARGGSIDRTIQPGPAQYGRQTSTDVYSNQSMASRHTSQDPVAPANQTQDLLRDVPNFDAMAANTTEDQLSQHPPPPSAQPYQKPTYQSPEPVSSHHSSQSHPSEGLISPLAEFSFDLPTSDMAKASQPPHWQDQSAGQNVPERRSDPPTEYPNQDPMSQFPPRSASRGNMRPSRDPHDRPPVPPQQDYPPAQYTNHQEDVDRNPRAFDQSYSSQQQSGAGGRPNPSAQRPPMYRDQSRGGYDPRLQPDRMGTPQSVPSYQNPPSRPMTSNSGRPPLNGPGPRSSADGYQPSIRGQTDPSARPVPFRPGLMQPPPQAPTPVNQPPREGPPSGPPTAQPKGTVTVQELNELRRAYQEQPESHVVGMKFAKRLVEASKVLPDQNGAGDPKQVAKNRERYILDAHKIIKRLIQTGSTEAMFYMADCYGQGSLGLAADSKEAFSLYQSAAKLGHPQAAYRVAVCCEIGPEDGGGTRRDPLKAVQWYRRAASLGDAPAMYKMGMILLKGLLGQPRNPREAISWLKRAAERADAENPHALHELALLYESAQPNDIVIRDEKYALQLFTQAADLGYKYSQFRLASAYEYGKLGCTIDPRLSIGWYTKAAAQGEHQAELALSGWYLTGSEPILQQSDTEAYLWARKAAGSGLAKAEYAMGYYTEVGIGTGVNVEEAKKWYFRAAAQNYAPARERLEVLKRGGARMQKTRVSRSNVGKHNEGECKVM